MLTCLGSHSHRTLAESVMNLSSIYPWKHPTRAEITWYLKFFTQSRERFISTPVGQNRPSKEGLLNFEMSETLI